MNAKATLFVGDTRTRHVLSPLFAFSRFSYILEPTARLLPRAKCSHPCTCVYGVENQQSLVYIPWAGGGRGAGGKGGSSEIETISKVF